MKFDPIGAPAEASSITSSRPPRWAPWLTTEIAALKSFYPAGGSRGVQLRLPQRSLASIRAKAAEIGLRCARPSTLGHSFARVYPQSDAVDQAIRDGYTRATRKGDIKILAERIGRPAWWVQKRAASFGLTRTNRTRLDAWTEAEVELLTRWRLASLTVIARKFRDAGHERTETAIALQIKRRSIDTNDPDAWSATELGPCFGVNPATVADWIERRELKAKRVTWGPNGKLVVKRADLRAWVKAHPEYVDLRRVDQAWFWEVMFT